MHFYFMRLKTKYIESDNMLNTFWLLFFKTRDIRENIERKKYDFQTPFTSELRSARVKDSGIFYFSGIGIVAPVRER